MLVKKCIFAFRYIYMDACMFVLMEIHAYIRTYLCLYRNISLLVAIFTWMYICMCACMCVCVRAPKCVRVYAQAFLV